MEFFAQEQFRTLANPGVVSVQLLSPHNSPSSRITITQVTMQAGAVQPRHAHPASEQIWVAISGSGKLLLADGATREFTVGNVARFAAGDVHGFDNAGPEPFVYMSMTTPPIDFAYAYGESR